MTRYNPALNSICFRNPVHKNLKVCVVVPVKDEADHLISTLNALRHQYRPCGKSLDRNLYEVLVLVNNSRDQSFSICKAYQKAHPSFRLYVENIVIKAEEAHIGTVRKMLMDEALLRLENTSEACGIIASTDGDSQVDQYWIHHIMEEVANGAEVVGGRIIPQSVPALSKMQHLKDVSYRHYASRLESVLDPIPYDPWPRHFQCYGPSVAVTNTIYRKAGGMPAIPYLEDEEFRKALKRIDARIRKSPHVKIFTSSRFAGRVEFGFSVQLQKWSEMQVEGNEEFVHTLETLCYKFLNKSRLRHLWQYNGTQQDKIHSLNVLAAELMLDKTWLETKLGSSPYFEGLWEEIEQTFDSASNLKLSRAPISEVIADLRSYFSQGNHVRLHLTTKQTSGSSVGLAG